MDVGSNTVHALVADWAGGRLEDVSHHVLASGLGPEVARAGRIGETVGAQALDALGQVLADAARFQPDSLVAGATEAVRRAPDRSPFLRRASEVARVPVHLLTSEREARLGFEGVAGEDAPAGRWLMGDVGGGSTQLVAAEGPEPAQWVSLPVGSGALAARHLSDPPAPGEREHLRAAAAQALRPAPDWAAKRLLLTGGTAMNLPGVLSRGTHTPALARADLGDAIRTLDAAPAARLSAALELPEGRVLALRAGAEILLLLLQRYGLGRVEISYRGLRHGMLRAFVARGDEWWR